MTELDWYERQLDLDYWARMQGFEDYEDYKDYLDYKEIQEGLEL